MKNLRNKNHPPKADIVQNYLESSWDVVYEVYRQLANIETVGDAITNGDLDEFLSETDINTIAKLNAILSDATLGDFATQAEAEAGVSNTKTMTPLRVAQAIAVLAAGIQNNFNAAGDPGVNDDSNAGYSVGSVWINQTPTPPEAFRCADPSPGAAVWIKTSLTIDELAVVALSGNSDDLIEGVTQLLMTVAERDKLTNIEPMATADQTPAEIEAGYNAQVAVVTQLEAEAGALTTVKRWTPERVKQAIQALSTGGLAWSSANSSIAVAKSTGTVFYALPATVTATLPANPAVGDSLMIVNNDNNALDAYNVNVTAGGSNEIRQQNVVMIPQATVVQGETALFVCYDAGATKRWHMQKWVSSLDIGAGGGVNALFKTGAYTAAAGDIVGVGSDTAAITITLPASPSTDDYVAVWDADDNAGTNTITVARNGNTIDGVAADFEINIDGGRVDLIYNGTTWKVAYSTPGAAGFSGIETWQFRPYDFTQVAGETTRTTINVSGNNLDALSFPGSAGYHWAGTAIVMPKRWDGGDFRFRYGWVSSNADTGVVEVGLYNGLSASDGDDWNASGWDSGNGTYVRDTGLGAANRVHFSDWSGWHGMDGSVLRDGLNVFRLQRNSSSSGDTFTGDALVFIVEVQWRSEAPTDD